MLGRGPATSAGLCDRDWAIIRDLSRRRGGARLRPDAGRSATGYTLVYGIEILLWSAHWSRSAHWWAGCPASTQSLAASASTNFRPERDCHEPRTHPGIDVAYWCSTRSSCLRRADFLSREDRREGYPLEDAVSGGIQPGRADAHASEKSFLLPFVRAWSLFRLVNVSGRYRARRTDASWCPLPDGDPWPTGSARPPGQSRKRRMSTWRAIRGSCRERSRRLFGVGQDPDMIGWPVVGADGKSRDRSDWDRQVRPRIRYISWPERGLACAMMMARIDKRRRRVGSSPKRRQFAGVPRPGTPGRSRSMRKSASRPISAVDTSMPTSAVRSRGYDDRI